MYKICLILEAAIQIFTVTNHIYTEREREREREVSRVPGCALFGCQETEGKKTAVDKLFKNNCLKIHPNNSIQQVQSHYLSK